MIHLYKLEENDADAMFGDKINLSNTTAVIPKMLESQLTVAM
jgi:hypothetical protein